MTVENAPIPPGMGQCSVTGRVVPEDELVTIQGQRVCAEGKAILLERLRSGEGLPGESEKPTVLRRFGAIFLDGLIIGVPFAVIQSMFTASARSSAMQTGSVGAVFFAIGVVTLISTIVSIVYFGAMHAAKGQTVGKMAAKLRVVNNADGSPILPATAWTRALLYAGPNLISAIAYFTGAAALITVASLLVAAWGLANVIVALVDRDRQRALHDRICGTRVIEIAR